MNIYLTSMWYKPNGSYHIIIVAAFMYKVMYIKHVDKIYFYYIHLRIKLSFYLVQLQHEIKSICMTKLNHYFVFPVDNADNQELNGAVSENGCRQDARKTT